MRFPVEAVPDGHPFAPHHLTWAVLLLLVAVWVVSDNFPHREPLLAGVGGVLALFAFLFIWPFYPQPGATLTLFGVLVALVGVLLPGGVWASYPVGWRGLALLAVLVALDDAVSHAFGIWTPVDWAWRAYLLPVLV